MKILVTGPRGFVGSRIMCAVPDAVPCPTLRGANQEQLRALIDGIQPDLIINTAAISDTSVCERDPDASYEANVTLPVMLARAAGGARLISFSSDQVYNGCAGDGAYREDDALSPVNVYGRHKLEAEARVLDILPDAVMLRATWMYDMPIYGGMRRGNFLLGVLRSAMAGRQIRCSSAEYRGITYVREAAENLTALADVPGGVYNFGSENALSMYATVTALLDAVGAPHELLLDAAGGHNLHMDCARLASYGIHFRQTEDGLRKCVADYGLHV